MELIRIFSNMNIFSQCFIFSIISIFIIDVIKKHKKISLLEIYGFGIIITYILAWIIQLLYFSYVMPNYEWHIVGTFIDLLFTSIISFFIAMFIYDKIKQLKEDENSKEVINKIKEGMKWHKR